MPHIPILLRYQFKLSLVELRVTLPLLRFIHVGQQHRQLDPGELSIFVLIADSKNDIPHLLQLLTIVGFLKR